MSIGAVGRGVVWLIAGVVLAAAGFVAATGFIAVQHRPGPAVDMTPVMRSYEVRPEIADEVESALQAAIAPPGGATYGRVTLSATGQLLVIAPAFIQTGVEQILNEVAARKLAATPSIHFEAWLVTASPGAPAEAPNLQEIEPALRAVEQSKGPAHFELLEKLSTQAQSGQKSSVQGESALLEVTGSLRQDNRGQPLVAAQLALQFLPPRGGPVFNAHGEPYIRAQTELKPGELLVLGQSRLSSGQDADRAIYYIVRATL